MYAGRRTKAVKAGKTTAVTPVTVHCAGILNISQYSKIHFNGCFYQKTWLVKLKRMDVPWEACIRFIKS